MSVTSLVGLAVSMTARAYKISPMLTRRVLRLMNHQTRRVNPYWYALITRYLEETLHCCVCRQDFSKYEGERDLPQVVFALHGDTLDVAHAACYCQNGQLPLRLKDPRLVPLFHDLVERFPKWLRRQRAPKPKGKPRKKQFFRREPAVRLRRRHSCYAAHV